MGEPLFVEPECGVVAGVFGIEGKEDADALVVAAEGGLDDGEIFFGELVAFFYPAAGGVGDGFEVLGIFAAAGNEFIAVERIGYFEWVFGEGEPFRHAHFFNNVFDELPLTVFAVTEYFADEDATKVWF